MKEHQQRIVLTMSLHMYKIQPIIQKVTPMYVYCIFIYLRETI